MIKEHLYYFSVPSVVQSLNMKFDFLIMLNNTNQSYTSNRLIKTIKMESEDDKITLAYKRIESFIKNMAITVSG